MTPEKPVSHEELVYFATYVYGSKWRESLAKQLDISRKTLVLTLASEVPVPQNIITSILNLVETRLAEFEHERRSMSRRVNQIRNSINAASTATQPRVSRKTAS